MLLEGRLGLGDDVTGIESLVGEVAGAESADGRLAAFAEIVRRYQDMAYGCAYAILGDFHLAEDASQEAFVAAYRELPNLREPKAFAGWLRRPVLLGARIARSVHSERCRSPSPAPGGPASAALSQLAKLPAVQPQALALRT